MLDERSLRLLAEMGIDVYEPRVVSDAPRVSGEAPVVPVRAIPATPPPSEVSALAAVLVIGASEGTRWASDLLAALQWLGVASRLCASDDVVSLRAAAGLLVLGESHARTLSTALTAFEQERMHWVIGAEAGTLMANVDSRRALWGEMKRISRLLDAGSR